MATTTDASTLLARLNTADQKQPLAILNLAEPILSANNNPAHLTNTSRDFSTSTASASAAPSTDPTSAAAAVSLAAHDASHNAPLTPSSLAADLQHYRDLFSKLRFSYLEQVTKEKYLRSIVGDPPLLVTPKDNAELEEKLAGMKRDLKAKKTETDALVAELEGFARSLAQKYEGVQASRRSLESLPAEVEDLRAQVEGLREEVRRKQAEIGREEADQDPRYAMGMEATRAAVEDQRRKEAEVAREIQELERRLPGKVRECERAERELEDMDRRKEEVTWQAKEVRRIREEGGRDLVGERGRWYRAQEGVLTGLLQT